MDKIPDTYQPASYTGVIDPETRRSVSAARDIGQAFTHTVLRNAVIFVQQAIKTMYPEGSKDRDRRLEALNNEVRVLLKIWQAPWDKTGPGDPSPENMVGQYLEEWDKFHTDLDRDDTADEVHSILCRAVMDEMLAFLLTTPYASTGLVPAFGEEHDILTALYARFAAGGKSLFRRIIRKTFGKDKKYTALSALTTDIICEFRSRKAEEIKEKWKERKK